MLAVASCTLSGTVDPRRVVSARKTWERPFIVHWPKGAKAEGAIRRQSAPVIDVVR